MLATVFEGLAHPYKDNIVRFSGKTYVPTQPIVKPAIMSNTTLSTP